MSKDRDLSKIDPRGRVDVAAYRLAEMLTKKLEEQHGLMGLWETSEPYVQNMIKRGLSGVRIPSELSSLLKLVQMNIDLKVNGAGGAGGK